MTIFETKGSWIKGKLIEDFELTNEEASSIVGNLAHECEGFEDFTEDKPLIPGSKGGFGWAQWTGPRRRAFEEWCRRKNYDPYSDIANYSFLFRELIGSEKKAILVVKKPGTLHEKTRRFCDTFLRPGIPHYDSRYIWAEKAVRLTITKAPVEVKKPKTLLQVIIDFIMGWFK